MSYLKLITPVNLAEEKERFFASEDYSPQLKYDWSDEVVKKFVSASAENAELAEALLDQDGARITKVAAKYFDVRFRDEDLTFAHKLIEEVPPSSNGTADAYAKLLRQKLSDLGLDYTVTVVDEHGFQGRPNHKNHTMKISQHLHLQFLSLDGIVNHELVHMIRAVNGDYNKFPKAKDYLPTEEGLACLVQDKFLVNPTPSAFQHAIEYLAAYLSQTMGFREIFNFLIEHGCDVENAWLRGIRQKFGMQDTSLPGGLVKSGMYFYHENLLRGLSEDELIRLFVGKISLEDLPNHPIYTGVIPRADILRVLW